MSNTNPYADFDTSIAFQGTNGERYLIGIGQRSTVLHYASNPSNMIKANEHPRNFERIWTVCGRIAFNVDVHGSGWYSAEEEERFSQDGWDDMYTSTVCKSCVARVSK